MKITNKRSKTAFLLSVCAAMALCTNLAVSCSADDDNTYYGDELKTRAMATRSESPEPYGGEKWVTSSRDTIYNAEFVFFSPIQPKQPCTFVYFVRAYGDFESFEVRVDDNENENYLVGTITGSIKSHSYNAETDTYNFTFLFSTHLESDPTHVGRYEMSTDIPKGDFH